MTYRSMLVHLDHTSPCPARIRLAIRLARDHECQLVGLAPTGTIGIPPGTEIAAPLADYAALAWKQLRSQAEWIVQRFREECETAGFSAFEARIDEAATADSLVRHAHCSDLTLLGQPSANTGGPSPRQDMVDDVVLNSARPTLLVPRSWERARAGTKVLVAWDDSREAARALNDALPLLQRAGRVELVQWRDAQANEDNKLRARLDQVHRWLAWHGVTSHCYLETARHSTAEAIRSRASEMEADLIVMGAYGHARWTERVLGGATRDTLAGMNVPVLMSH